MTKGADATLIAPGTRSEPYMIPAGNAFSFGKVVIEVRPACLATSSVGGGEMGDLSFP